MLYYLRGLIDLILCINTAACAAGEDASDRERERESNPCMALALRIANVGREHDQSWQMVTLVKQIACNTVSFIISRKELRFYCIKLLVLKWEYYIGNTVYKTV